MHKIKYLRVIVTENCNLNCFFCHKEGIITKNKPSCLSTEELTMCLKALCEAGIQKIKFLGGEPTICGELPKVISMLKNEHPKADLSMITNGITDKKRLISFVEAGLNRINVSLHGFDNDTFYKITGGNGKQLKQCVNNIRFLSSINKLGKINYVLLRGENENEFKKVLEFIHTENIVLDVLNYISDDIRKNDRYRYTFDEIKAMITSIYKVEEIYEYENKFSINSQRLKLVGGGVINLKINALNKTAFLKACSACGKYQYCVEGISAVRLTNRGIVKPCLFRDDMTFDLIGSLKKDGYTKTVNSLNIYFENL